MARRIDWTDAARADVRFMDQGEFGVLKDSNPKEYRLRYRIRFLDHEDTIEILSVRHRREAYR